MQALARPQAPRRGCACAAGGSPPAVVAASAAAAPSAVRFRPCIDIHKGKVKQIVGSSLKDLPEAGAAGAGELKTNFVSDKPSAFYSRLYAADGLAGGHVIMLGADDASKCARFASPPLAPGETPRPPHAGAARALRRSHARVGRSSPQPADPAIAAACPLSNKTNPFLHATGRRRWRRCARGRAACTWAAA